MKLQNEQSGALDFVNLLHLLLCCIHFLLVHMPSDAVKYSPTEGLLMAELSLIFLR